MRFLVSEFSTENLLFVTEYLQLKSLLSLSDKEMRSLKLTFSMELPANLPTPKMIQDLNLDLEQIRRNQQYRKEKKLKRQKELKKKLMVEIKRQSSLETMGQTDDDEEEQDEPEEEKGGEKQDEVNLALSPSSPQLDGNQSP
eukprot:CAMPEP_0197052584 /NCGR_PEP_ID=MMETSP1384-20130603/27044_1 /TAXON_ID=29189 /ORGANISM="Ammonia sp." /LENGTH=141 /DNA_ID=CAMNT_0042485353 /DNA_START=1 /DNA_END=423 /DNA_ORIENTATION=+